jgi:hypothetical protein
MVGGGGGGMGWRKSEKTSKPVTAMGRRSKASQARLQNLGNHKSRQARIDDITDSEDEDHFPPPNKVVGSIDTDDDLDRFIVLEDLSDDESDDMEGSDEELDEDEVAELRTEADVLQFAALLAEAQAVAVKVEREKAEFKPKRKHHYTGNSARTKRYHTQKRRQLASTGQKFIGDWFKKREGLLEQVPESGSESEDNATPIDIGEHVARVFPDTESINMIDKVVSREIFE